LKWPFAGLFVASGILHFAKSDVYLRLMPPFIPMHSEIVAISGVVEGTLGLLLLVPRAQHAAAWGLVATLVAIFPANIYGAVTAGTSNPAMPDISVEVAWLRLPIQPLLIAWAYWYTRP
jgi:uncharacterized membrane protein